MEFSCQIRPTAELRPQRQTATAAASGPRIRARTARPTQRLGKGLMDSSPLAGGNWARSWFDVGARRIAALVVAPIPAAGCRAALPEAPVSTTTIAEPDPDGCQGRIADYLTRKDFAVFDE